jgi:sugar/nucleoside kinase (ribokinase family)
VIVLAGLCTLDLVQRVEEFPAPAEKVQSLSVSTAAGGPATNAAVAVAALGGAARLLTAVGAHPLASVIFSDLLSCGVSVVDLTPDSAAPPPISAVTVRDRDGERTVVAHNAAGVSLDLDGLPLDDVRDASAVLLDGHHPELALRVAETARAHGVPVIVDAGSWRPVFADLLPLVDVCACSAAFPEDPEVPVVTRTHGGDPVTWRVGGESGEVPVAPVDARDTAGAGDVWHGALAYGIGELGRVPTAAELPGLIKRANAVAGVRIAHPNPRGWQRYL